MGKTQAFIKTALAAIVLMISFSTAVAKEGDSDATGKITSVENAVFQIRVKGSTRNGPLWLGCTFFPGTARERDLQAERKNVRGKDCLFVCSGDFDHTFKVPRSLEEWAMGVARGEGDAPYVVALWRYYVFREDCHEGPGGGACEYCRKNGYHLEDCVYRGRGRWAFDKKTTTQEELEQAQRGAAAREEAERRAKIEE